MAGPGFGTTGTYTPLQLTAGAGLLNNEGIVLPQLLVQAINEYNNLAIVTTLQDAISAAPSQGISAANIENLKKLGANTCPALGSSIPTAFQGINPLLPATKTGGFGRLVLDNANLYIGNGKLEKFCQIYQITSGYRSTVNELICSSVNATTYLGPTFTNMNDLISGYATAVNRALKCFGRDMAQTGVLFDFKNLPNFGTPGGLLQQISNYADIPQGTLSCIEEVMITVGLTPQDLIDLATPQASTRDLTEDQYNRLQRLAYQAMTIIEGACLEFVTTILNVVTPDITTLADLLDIQKLFPTSWPSMTVPTVQDERVPIFNIDGSINPLVYQAINDASAIVLPQGCDELAKIIPPEQAAANKAFQASLQQISGISTITPPALSAALLA